MRRFHESMIVEPDPVIYLGSRVMGYVAVYRHKHAARKFIAFN